MIRNIQTDGEKELFRLKELYNEYENIIKSNILYQNISSIQNDYFQILEWIINHNQNISKIQIKKLNSINYELFQHIKGFDILIQNQQDGEIIQNMIQTTLNLFKKSNSKLKDLQYEIDNY